jgi:hypothetical protein
VKYTSRNTVSGGCVRAWSFACVLFFLLAGGSPLWAQQPSTPELYPVERDGKHGYIDCSGRIAIPFDYDGADRFSEGLAPIKIGGRYGFLDTEGKLVIAPQFAEVAGFSEGLAPVREAEKWGYVDRSGNWPSNRNSILLGVSVRAWR